MQEISQLEVRLREEVSRNENVEARMAEEKMQLLREFEEKSVSLQRCPAAAAVILSHFVTNTLCEKIVVFSTDCRCI